MEKLKKMIEDVMVAITFAEAGEFDEAKKIMGTEVEREDRVTAAATAKS
jgi:hypothetical protein